MGEGGKRVNEELINEVREMTATYLQCASGLHGSLTGQL